jgi:hypothetical protein
MYTDILGDFAIAGLLKAELRRLIDGVHNMGRTTRQALPASPASASPVGARSTTTCGPVQLKNGDSCPKSGKRSGQARRLTASRGRRQEQRRRHCDHDDGRQRPQPDRVDGRSTPTGDVQASGQPLALAGLLGAPPCARPDADDRPPPVLELQRWPGRLRAARRHDQSYSRYSCTGRGPRTAHHRPASATAQDRCRDPRCLPAATVGWHVPASGEVLHAIHPRFVDLLVVPETCSVTPLIRASSHNAGGIDGRRGPPFGDRLAHQRGWDHQSVP